MDSGVHGRQPSQDISTKDKLDSSNDESLAIGVSLSCDDMSDEGDECRLYRFYSAQHRSIDLVRATVVRHCPDGHGTASGSAARATFSSPVMSRQHARISFEDDGTVSFTDLASMHGSYIQTAVAGSTRLSDKLVPHKPYTLRSGDTIHLGKSIYRNDRYWQPVVVRVTLLQPDTDASGQLPSSVNPALDASNRYGIYSEDEDEDISSSSFDEGDEEDLSSYSSSSSTSPLSSPINLGLPASINHKCREDNSAMGNKVNTDDLGAVDTGLSAGARLRSMLPLPFQSFHNLQNLQLPPLPPFPPLRPHLSLRDLGLFGSTDHISGSEASGNRNTASISDAIEDGDVTLNVDSQGPETDFKQKAHEDEIDSSNRGGSRNEGDSYSYAFPSYPENQLGLADAQLLPIFVSETNPGYASTENAGEVGNHEIRIENEDGDGDDLYADEPESENEDDNRDSQDFEVESEDQARFNGGEEYEAPMEISPSPSLDSSPSFRAQVLGLETKTNLNAGADADVDEFDLQANARVQQIAEALRESDGKPKFMEERLVDSGLAAAETAKPKPTSLPQLTGHDSLQSSVWNWNSNWDGWYSGSDYGSRPLLSQVHALEARMVELRDSAAILKATSFPAVSSTPLPSVVSKEVEKELAGIREELRRLSSLMESAVTKLGEANAILHSSSAQEPTPLATRVEQSVQANDWTPTREMLTRSADSAESSGSHQVSVVQPRYSQAIPSSSSIKSLKRRRNDDEESEEAISAVADSAELSSERGRYCERPTKRARTGIEVGKVMRNVASAAGYTSLGMVIAWAALAYAP